MIALVGLVLGMLLGIIGRELWAWLQRGRELKPEEMQRICRELAGNNGQHRAGGAAGACRELPRGLHHDEYQAADHGD
jgi:hypothetical protein